ncbi:LysR family transcriptional regulator [Chromohalobacter sp.]|uniref:LysR family transcriptional regulator n=1 Tax=Chromohalobacter sp. TaxID=50740 RepID=UPI001D325072|nr:LysR family transcriptional regulator [Chromohalobacter sp.]NQY45043.1 LysR family transcriptional regulator [Chromohalobacter sp.]
MDHRQLAFLCALARERHFGRAAKACHVTQPTLSARLRQLEEELATPLIRRGHRFEGFTAEGERVLGHARRILGEFEALRGDLASPAPLVGRLTLGVIPTALNALTEWLPTLRAAHPGLVLRVRELATPMLAQGLEDGGLDLVIGYLDAPAMAGFAHRPLFDEYPALVASPAHFALPEAPQWSQLAEYPLCLLTPDMHQRHLLEMRLAAHGLTLTPALETDATAALGEWLLAGLGVSILPEQFVRRRWLQGGEGALNLVARRLPGEGDRVGLLWPQGTPRGRRLQAVLDLWQMETPAT